MKRMFYYGDAASGQPDEVLVSFGYGSIAQCAANRTPGEISFGYDKALNCGAIFRSGELVSSRVLDLKLDNNADGSKTVTVHYITNGGQVVSDTFAVADPSLVSSVAEQAALQAIPTEDVNSIKIKLQGSDLIKSLSTPMSVTPISEDNGYTSYAIQLNVDGKSLSVDEDGKLAANTFSYKLEKDESDGKEVYTLKQTDKDGVVSDCGSITINADKYLSSVTMAYAVIVDGQYIETANTENPCAVPCLKFTWNDDTAQYIKMSGGNSCSCSNVSLKGSTYITVPSDMKGAIELNYTDLFNKIKEDLASIGIGDHETVNTLQNERLEKIEGSYVRAAEIVDGEDGKKVLKLTVTSKDSVAADEVVKTVEFSVSDDVDLSGLMTTVSEMGQRVENIEVRVSVIENMADDLNGLTTTVSEIGQNVENMSGDLSGLTITVSEMGENVESIEARVSNVESMSDDLSGLTTTVSEMGQNVENMSGELSGLTTTVSEMGENVENIEARVSDIESRPNGWIELDDLFASNSENGE